MGKSWHLAEPRFPLLQMGTPGPHPADAAPLRKSDGGAEGGRPRLRLTAYARPDWSVRDPAPECVPVCRQPPWGTVPSRASEAEVQKDTRLLSPGPLRPLVHVGERAGAWQPFGLFRRSEIQTLNDSGSGFTGRHPAGAFTSSGPLCVKQEVMKTHLLSLQKCPKHFNLMHILL